MIKVYEVSRYRSDEVPVHWMHNSTRTSDIRKADIVVFPGGSDINPSIYKESVGFMTHYSEKRDKEQIDEFNKARKLQKHIFGICRGAQLITALAGGKLVQHIHTHGGSHNIRVQDVITKQAKEFNVNSIHHQMMYPFNLRDDEYKILGRAIGTKVTSFLDGKDQQMTIPEDRDGTIEPEIVYYPKIKSLGVQFHPEMMGIGTEASLYINQLIKRFIENEI